MASIRTPMIEIGLHLQGVLVATLLVVTFVVMNWGARL
jgi:hypothetical protein